MKRKPVVLFILFISASSFLSAEEMSLQDIFSRVLENDDAILLADESIESAYQAYRVTRLQGIPSVSLSTDPAYGVGMRRDFSFDDFPPDPRTTITNSFSAGIDFSGLLPTGGVVSAGIEDTFQYRIQLAENDLERNEFLEQKPSFSLALSQPVFVGGRFIDAGLMDATVGIAELGWKQQQESARLTANSRLFRAAQLYVQLLSIQRNRKYLEQSISLARDQLEQTAIDRDLGRASENQVLGLEVVLNRRQEQMLDNELLQLQTEHQLGQMIHQRDFAGINITDKIDSILVSLENELSDINEDTGNRLASSYNPELALQRLGLESAILQDRVNNGDDAPNVSLAFAVNPRYPDERENSDEFAASFSDFFEEDAGVDFNFSFSVQIPLTGRKKKEAQAAADESARRIAEINIRSAENIVFDNLTVSRRRDDLLNQRIKLLQIDLEYQRNRLEREEKLLESRTSTKIDVNTIRLDLVTTQNQLWQTKGDKMLNLLDLAVLTGRDLMELSLP